ncbi:phage tail tape measure protein, partial [bacterium]|nr:phage tail tape measure protein [bacterium]
MAARLARLVHACDPESDAVLLARFTLDSAAARSVVSQATTMFNNIRGRVDLQIDKGSVAQVQRLSASAAELQANFRALNAAAAPAASAIGRVTSSLTSAAAAGSSASSGLRAAAASTRAVGAAAADASYSVQEFGKQVALSAKRFIAFQTAAGSLFAITRALREGVSGAIEFDLGLNKLRAVSQDTAAEVAGVGREVSRLATGLGSSSADLLDAAVTLRQAGLATRDLKEVLGGVALASLAPSFSNVKQTVEGAIASYAQFGRVAGNVRDQLGAINAVAAEFATESADLISAVQKAGGTAAQTGASFNELLAVFTSVRSTTRESADSISTGLRTIFTRLQRNDTVDSLRQLGVNLRYTRGEAEALGQVNLEDQFVGAYEAVRRLSEGLSKIRTTDPRYASAIETLGGYRQISRVLPLVQQFSEAQRALNVARLGSASLEAAAATRQDALATKVAKTREEFQRFANEVVQTKGFRAMADSVLSLASGLAQVLDVVKPLVPLMVTLGTVKLAQGITQFGTGLYQGFSGSLGGARPAPRRFAVGGVVPGVGSGDTVPAQLEPGEFVIRKSSAQRIGYDNLYALNAQRFADGGRVGNNVVTPANINRLIREYQAKTGIDFRKGLGVTFTIGYGKAAGIKDTAYGSFNIDSRKLVLNPKTITSIEQLRKTLAHELGHAVDTHFSGKASGVRANDLASHRGGLLGSVAKDYRDQSLSLQALTGQRMSAQYATYRLARHETFADAFRDHVTGDGRDARIDSITRQAALETGASRVGRALGWVRRRFMRFATGGSADGKVDALLTPGEFVVDKKTAARLGPDALNRMNVYGDLPRFAMGGPVLRYATGGSGFDLNALIMRVMTQVSGSGRGADERMSGAGERIARAVATGRIPTDPAQAEAFLLRAAGLGAKAADERERRYRTRERSGLVNQTTAAPVIDSAAAGANAGIPLSSAPPRGRGREAKAAVAERNAYQSREHQ